MTSYILKRDGRTQEWNRQKVVEAIKKALIAVDGQLTKAGVNMARRIAKNIEEEILSSNEKLSVEQIQDRVENSLMNTNRKDVAKAYILYREERTQKRGNVIDKTVQEIVNGESEYWNTENSNKNAKVVTTQRDYLAGALSTDLTRRKLLPKDIVDAHDQGIIHFHDADYFAQNALNNCCLINLEDMLQNGTVINGVMIEKPHKFLTAMTIATQIILGVSSSQYGGCTVSMTHLAPFVRDSYNKYYEEAEKEVTEWLSNDTTEAEKKSILTHIAKGRLKKEIEAGVQTFNYQVNSMTNTNGQAPFLSVNLYLGETDEYKEELAMIIEEFLKQRILGFKNEKGVYITPAFPKLLYVLEEDNMNKDSKYYYLTELAAECTAKRMVPDYISEKKMKEYKLNKYGEGDCYPCMGCRSFLTPDRIKGNPAKAKNYSESKGKYYGRFNMGVVTINLADIALSAKKACIEKAYVYIDDNQWHNLELKEFWRLFEERTELCHKALRLRYERIAQITSDAAPLLWQHGAFARLNKHESVKSLLHGGYSTLSLGYAALYECVKAMTGESHTAGGKEFGLEVMQKLNDKCQQWKAAEDIDYSLYGTPIESTTYKFAKNLKKRFGKIEGITDKDYITNSYHVPVFEEIDAFSKLKLESEFQRLSPGGAISYVEVPNMQKNIPAVMELIKFIYNNIMYAEINSKSDYCQKCEYEGEIEIKGSQGHLFWQCPNCGNTDQDTMNIARRTCGYIGTNYWNQGRTQEIKERVLHLD